MRIDAHAPKRPACRYHGSKWLLAAWVISHLPERHDVYVETHGGALSVLLRKARSPMEVAGDRDGDVVNFFRVLRDDEEALVRAIRLTPYAEAEYRLSFEATGDPLESARRFYVRAQLSIAGPTAQWQNGWRRQKVLSRGKRGAMTPAATSFMRTGHLHDVAERLRGVALEQADGVDLVRRYDQPEAVFYVDPPYAPGTRKAGAYHCEMDEAAHGELAAALHGIEGMALVSGYACPLYDEIYPDWLRVDKQARVNGRGRATESLWLNPALVERLRQEERGPFAQE